MLGEYPLQPTIGAGFRGDQAGRALGQPVRGADILDRIGQRPGDPGEEEEGQDEHPGRRADQRRRRAGVGGEVEGDHEQHRRLEQVVVERTEELGREERREAARREERTRGHRRPP